MRKQTQKTLYSIKRMAGILSLCLLLLLAGCSAQPGAKKLRIVTTIFPLYDWARNIVGDSADVELSFLQDTGVDLHSYQPTAEDMVKIASCDLFIYVGGESDSWVADALKNSKNENRKALNLMEILGDQALAEEEKEGMQAEDHADHDAAHGSEDDHERGEEERDEHVWLSLKNASLFTGKIADVLAELAVDKKETFRTNAAAYQEKLDALQKEYKAAAAAAKTRTLLFGDRFPFLYLTKELGLDYYAAFKGCSAESEASFETIVFLAGKADELSLKVILKTESGDGRLAETIRQTAKAQDLTILTMDSLQSVTKAREAEGVTYLAVMQANLEVLKEALK